MEFIALLALIVLIIISFQLSRISKINKEASESIRIAYLCIDEEHKTLREHSDATFEKLASIELVLESLSRDINEIKYVSDIYYKYKLPSKKEQKELDKMAIEVEFLDG
ncbi:hypothetical protein [Xenorhabdus bovienii]|uniref:hypothetical protein n=1 Tax=Xenorhabdus bovienii TaxID=40576 RepID=UPI00237CE923|nr:hypothetical protein [Xenorhabdus bovienii]MDE1483991.1 hypothetical protein [Xenorhabdus bovienii]MDE9447681.1 hypothetical protein [Xenorhabdus bovienii]